MRRKVSKLRPSPNEEARLIREEQERRRKLRIQQVREQQRCIAIQIRQDVERRRQCELEQLGEELRHGWERQQREKLEMLQRLYQESLQLLGQGHRSAKDNKPDLAAVAQKEVENHTKAEERYCEALKELKLQRLKDHEVQTLAINARKMALQTEKERAAKVASLPPPPPNTVKQYTDSKNPHVVKKSDVVAFALTYHMPECTVNREGHAQQTNAHEGAELEARRQHHLQTDEKRKREEQLEKSRLRGKEALRREHLMQDRKRLLVELEHMQQTDLLRRRQQVSHMPPQIFQPLYKRHEMREDLQREMEFAFEDMYTGERRVKGDLMVQLMPETLPALSINSQDQELDITMDEVVTPDTENAQPDAKEEAERNEQETRVHVQSDKPKPAPRPALRKLLDRIQSQRSQWADHSSRVPTTDSFPVLSNQASEHDTTINTGSLTSEEKENPPPLKLLQPSHSPLALETSGDSTESETPAPCVLVNRMEEEEQKTGEVELEKEKQLVLLQQLEEQKSQLEQLLLEAQQEREHLKSAAESSVTLPAGPQPVVSELGTPAGEDDHTRRIRQYQRQMLEQKRIHQRSLEVARQRLEEYQRALRIRYSVTSCLLLPAVSHPGLSQSLQTTQSVNLPNLLQVPMTLAEAANIPVKMQTSMEVPTREPDMQVSTVCSTGSSFGVGSKLLPDKLKPMSNSLRNQQLDGVTEQPGSLRPSSSYTLSMANKPFTTHHSANIRPLSGPVHPISRSVTESSSPLKGCVDTRSGSFLQMDSLDFKKLQIGSLRTEEDDLDCQRNYVQEVQRGGLGQRVEVVPPKQQEEQRHGQKVQMEQMKQQKKLVPEPQVVENTKQTRLQLLTSLLKAIEESSGGTLSHLEEPPRLHSQINHDQRDPDIQTDAPRPASVLHTGIHPSHRVTKPPVTRVRLGTVKVMTEQHELSVIQEVEMLADNSLITGAEGSVAASHIADSGGVWEAHEECEWSVALDDALQPFALSGCGQPTDESLSGSTAISGSWRKRLLMGTGPSHKPLRPDPVLSVNSPLSSDSGRGADLSGPVVLSFPSHTESPHRAADSDCLSSTISTGSYISTEPDQNADRCDQEVSTGADLIHIGSLPGQSSTAGGPLFNDSSIQQIIQKYMRELDISLSTCGMAACEAPHVEVPITSVQRSLGQAPEHGAATGARSVSHGPSSSNAAGTRRSTQEYNCLASPVLRPVLHSEDPDVVQLAEESSCVGSEQSAEVPLVGHPSAHSSMIGQLPTCSDPDGWDSTMSRMIGSTHWLSRGEDFYAGHLMGLLGLEQSTTWLNDGQGESQMRPLVGELDEHHSESSGERSHVEASMLHGTVQSLDPDLAPERTEASSGLDSFYPLLPEVTHNNTADLSTSFHLPEHDVPDSPVDQSAWGLSPVSSPANETHPDQMVGSEKSPERLRSQEQYMCLSVLRERPAISTDVDPMAVTVSHLPLCDTSDMSTLQEEVDGRNDGDPVTTEGRCAVEHSSDLRYDFPVLSKVLDVSSERELLERSGITLVSLADTTVDEREEDEQSDKEYEKIQKEKTGPEFTLLPEEKHQSCPVTFLEFQWTPGRNLEEDVYRQKRAILLHKSSQRVEKLKAKGCVAKSRPEMTRGPANSEPVTSKAISKSGPHRKIPKPNTTGGSGSFEQRSLLQPPPGRPCRLQIVDGVKTFTPEPRKRDVSEMHQRTRRLYEQLEEVKHQRAMRSRHEAYAQNRLKAKEFHKKTLQKLRARQTSP
ncbi:centrosomal protein of 295 kDa [Betta splendens]|uniref:Centrosomal protein of 295 kDa n=1 Tax=Betta splendens TaxID=158456 RepID=A0A6P7P307_BETSP|nr:centrosomal protein of 295 kDa [Betta splendens]